MTWDLRPGSVVIIPHPEAKNYGSVGKIGEKREDGHYTVILEEESKQGVKKNVHRLLGKWWVDSAIRGAVLRLPIVNLGATTKPKVKST